MRSWTSCLGKDYAHATHDLPCKQLLKEDPFSSDLSASRVRSARLRVRLGRMSLRGEAWQD